jgi:hypothetical protein
VLLGELVVVGTGELDVDEEEDDVVVGSGDVDDVVEVSLVVDGSDVVVVDGSVVVLVVLVTASAVVVPVVAVSVAAAGPRPVTTAVATASGTAASHVLRPALPRSDTGLHSFRRLAAALLQHRYSRCSRRPLSARPALRLYSDRVERQGQMPKLCGEPSEQQSLLSHVGRPFAAWGRGLRAVSP